MLRLFAILVAVVLAAAAAVAGAAWWWLDRPLALTKPSVEVTIEPGTSARDVAQAWVDAGVDAPAWALHRWFSASGDATRIRAGSYAIGPGTTPRELLRRLVAGDELRERVRLTEGWTLRQWREALAAAPHLQPTSAAMTDEQLMAAIGRPGVAPEGRFFPDTYLYGRGVSDLTVLRHAAQRMQRRLDDAWAARPPDTPLKSADELLTLASIVEKETGRAADRPLVAAVFVNRLKLGMPLQTDPTVIYGLGREFDGNLRKVHLQTDGPYNTYLRRGLPPTPIAMPGDASLKAVVRPATSKALYFVARGDGTSEFSDDLAAHNRAVRRFQLGGTAR